MGMCGLGFRVQRVLGQSASLKKLQKVGAGRALEFWVLGQNRQLVV